MPILLCACPLGQALRRGAPPSPAMLVLSLTGDDPSREVDLVGRRIAPSICFEEPTPERGGGRRSLLFGRAGPCKTSCRGCPRPSLAALPAGRVIPLPRQLVLRCTSAPPARQSGPSGFAASTADKGRNSPPSPSSGGFVRTKKDQCDASRNFRTFNQVRH